MRSGQYERREKDSERERGKRKQEGDVGQVVNENEHGKETEFIIETPSFFDGGLNSSENGNG